MKDKIFISHSSSDEKIVNVFTEKILRLGLDIPRVNIFCSSLEGMGIKTGDDFRDKIKNELQDSSLVILFMSNHYRRSEICQNEMGASWVLNKKVIPILISPLEHNQVGALHITEHIDKINTRKGLDNIIQVLTELPEVVIDFQNLNKYRDEFLLSFGEAIEQVKDYYEEGKVEIEAAFPGGEDSWRNYLSKSLNPNVPADNNAASGKYTVIAKFVVTKDGTLRDVQAETENGFGMEEEVIRVIKNGPKWIPALQNGRNVNAYRRQPVTFYLED